MSIQISGPEGYDYQYLATLMLALDYLDKENTEIYIEKAGEEDAQVVIVDGETKYTIDIQAKKKSEIVTINDYANWVTHFSYQSVDNCLLSKLEKDENRFVILVTNVRCNDDASKFLDTGIAHDKLNIGIGIPLLQKIIEACRNYSDSTILSGSRKEFIDTFLKALNPNVLRRVLKRAKFREKCTETMIKESIKSTLNRKFYISQSKTDFVLSELISIIKIGRGSSISISEDLLKAINDSSNENVFIKDTNHVNRVEKEACARKLELNHVLLLTGISFCGKTYLARELANDYLARGYTISILGELYGDSGAISFIKSRNIEDRLLILEDPLGQIDLKHGYINILNDIRSLVQFSKVNRKIIITCRTDILLLSMAKTVISECSFSTNKWIDLTLSSSEEIFQLWCNYYGKAVESTFTYEKMNKWLADTEGVSTLQLGHIANLFNNKTQLSELLELNPSDIVNIARIDSSDFAMIIEHKGLEACKTFIALGLSCNTYLQTNFVDLAFILDDKAVGIEYLLNDDMDDCENGFPKYKENYTIPAISKREIFNLKQRGILQIDNVQRIKFSHPIFYYATQILFNKLFSDALTKEMLIELVKQCINSLSINASICTLNVLGNLYNENSDIDIKRLMLMGLDSIFPTIKDKVIMFFENKINNLNEMEQKKLLFVLEHSSTVNIQWNENTPYIDSSRKGRLFGWSRETYGVQNDEVMVEKTLTSQEIWAILNARNSQNNIPQKISESALSYQENFIRAKAIRIIFANYAYTLSNIDDYLNPNEHPNYIYNLFRGFLEACQEYDVTKRKVILQYFKQALKRVSVSLISENFLVYFDDEYSRDGIDWSSISEAQRGDLWSIWYDVFIEFLVTFQPKYLDINEAHMFNVADISLQYINDNKTIVMLATAWNNWLSKYLDYNLPDDYGMGVADYLMKGTLGCTQNREKLVQNMLETRNTSFITTNCKVFCEYWNHLTMKERDILTNTIMSDRNDVKWIQAVILTRKKVPNEIINCIFEKPIELNTSNIDEIINILSQKDLLSSCLSVHTGHPQPLWWNGYHHSNCELWDNIIISVLFGSVNKSFRISLREFIDLVYNDGTRRIPNIYDIYDSILKDNVKRRHIFNQLLHETIAQNQSNKKAWDMLIENSTYEECEHYFDMIAENIELVQYYQDDEDILSLFSYKVVFGKIYPRIHNDNLIINHFINGVFLNEYKIAKEMDDKGYCQRIRSSIEEYLIDFYSKKSIRMSLTNTYIQRIIDICDIKSSILNDYTENTRRYLIDVVSSMHRSFEENEEIENWNK